MMGITLRSYRIAGARISLLLLLLLLLAVMAEGLVLAQPNLNEALNVSGGGLDFFSTSSFDDAWAWTVVSDSGLAHDAIAAARSGAIGYSFGTEPAAASILSTALPGPGVIGFWAKRTGNCQLDFLVDDMPWRTGIVNSEVDQEWHYYPLHIAFSGPRTVHWRMLNHDQSSANGQDGHYLLVDDVSWTPAEEDGCVFRLNPDGESYTLVAYVGNEEQLVVPAFHQGKPVTVIGSRFHDNDRLTDIIFPEGVLNIEAAALPDCGSLRRVEFPSTLQVIGEDAFAGCWNLEQALLPPNLTALGARAFQGTRLHEVVLPPPLPAIPEAAFAYCGELSAIVISANITAIGADAFRNCGLTSVVFSPRGQADITLGVACFAENRGLREFILPDGVTALPEQMLAGNAYIPNHLPAIRIPASVTALGKMAFDFCDETVFFFMGPPPAVAEPGLTSSLDDRDSALVVYQIGHQAAWTAALDGEGRFHGYPAESLFGEPIPLPEISTPGDRTSFIDSVAVTFTLHDPLPGDMLLVEYSEDGGATVAPTILSPGENHGGFLAVGPAQWLCTLTVTAGFRV
ncbi:MAG: leucine-rich repeat domain-containing protein, partial [Lentisphaeria bacterium]|nr:leucine-rich repeat domain-containing protein [Lentisphaeria bacterium]